MRQIRFTSALILFCTIILIGFKAEAQVGIGTTNPDSNAILEISAEDMAGGVLLPRIELVETTNSAPLTDPVEPGMIVYNTATVNDVTPGFYYHDGTKWNKVGEGTGDGNGWSTEGNAGTDADINFLGTTDAVPLQFRTGNQARFEITSLANANHPGSGLLQAYKKGTQGYPIYSFTDSPNTGLFLATPPGQSTVISGLGVTAGGIEVFRASVTGQLQANDGTPAAPAYSWRNSPNMGIYRNSNSSIPAISFSTDGIERMGIAEHGGVLINGQNNNTDKARLGIIVGSESGERGIFVRNVGSQPSMEEGILVITDGTAINAKTSVRDSHAGRFHHNGIGDNTGNAALIATAGNLARVIESASATGASIRGIDFGTISLSRDDDEGIGLLGIGNNRASGNPIASIFELSVPAEGAGVVGIGNTWGVYSVGNMHVEGNLTVTGSINGSPRPGNPLISDGIYVDSGDLSVTGDLAASGVKNFKIDHPLDPANKYLKHASVESNEVLNLYRGTEIFDADGQVVVNLPDYYEAVNKNPSYQLTPIGAYMQLYIAEEIFNGTFVIAGGIPGKKVSWTVQAERNDPYMQYYSEAAQMEVDKGENRGRYLTPEVYGQPKEKGIYYVDNANKVVEKVKTRKLNLVEVEDEPIRTGNNYNIQQNLSPQDKPQ